MFSFLLIFFNPLYSMQVLIFCARVSVPIAACRQLEGQQRFQGCTRCSKLLTGIYRRWGFSRNGQGSTCNRRWIVQHHMRTHQARRGVWQYTLILHPIFFFPPISHGENLFLFGSTIFFESKEITLTAHEIAAGMVMGRSLGTNAMHLGTYVLSQDPRKKRTKIMSPWVSVISFSPLWPLWHLCVSYRFESMPPCAYLSIFCHILFFATDPNDDRAHVQQHCQERFWVSRFKLWNGKTTFFFFFENFVLSA